MIVVGRRESRYSFKERTVSKIVILCPEFREKVVDIDSSQISGHVCIAESHYHLYRRLKGILTKLKALLWSGAILKCCFEMFINFC